MGTYLQDWLFKRLAFYKSSNELGLALLLEAFGQKEIKNTIKDLIG